MQKPTRNDRSMARELVRDYGCFTADPLTPVIGAEISGLDLSQPLTNEQNDAVHKALADHMVLVFRDQELTREDHKRFGRYFGELHTHPLHDSKGYGGANADHEILTVKTTKDSPYTAGNGWHTDVTCNEKPPMGSMLYITEIPEIGCGGDTLFSSMYAACDSLSEGFRDYLRTLVAVHDGARPYVGAYGATLPDGQSFPKAEHPVIGVHPDTGREVLYVNGGFTTRIKGLNQGESDAILNYLTGHISMGVRFQCRVRWEPNTLVFWDNRCTQHHASWDYYPHSRYGERVSIIGDPPGPNDRLQEMAQAAE